LEKEENFALKLNAKVIWLGNLPEIKHFTKSKKGKSWKMIQFLFHDKSTSFEIVLEEEKGLWLYDFFQKNTPQNSNKLTLNQMKLDYETNFDDFELFWYAKSMQIIRNNGLLVL